MKFCCDSRKYFESLNGEDRVRFRKHFRDRSFDQMPLIWTSIWEEMTESQRGAIWLDFTKVARLLYCSKDDVYAECLRAKELRHIWMVEYEYGPKWNRKRGVRLRTLSELSKDEISEAIPEIREFLQSLVNRIYQKKVVIYWSNWQNLRAGKPDYEFLDP